MTQSVTLPCAALLAMAIGVSPVVAQDASVPRPTQAVFGGNSSTGREQQLLEGTLSVAAAYNDTHDEVLASLSPLDRTGYFTALGGTLGYGWRGERVQFGANAGTNGRYYREGRELLSVNRYGGVGVEVNLARRTQIAVSQTVNYSPAYFTGMFPILGTAELGAVNALGIDYAASHLSALTSETTFGFSHGITRTATFSFESSIRHTAFSRESGYDDLNAYNFGGRYLHRVSRYASLRLGYAYRQGQYGVIGETRNTSIHDIDAGVDYNRALSVSRRTRLEFGTGSTIVNTPQHLDDGGTAGLYNQRYQYRVVGNLGLSHEFGRTWRGRLAYNRGVGLVQGFPEPLFSDGVTGAVGGFFSRRVEVLLNASYTNGQVGGSGAQNGLNSLAGAARMQVGLTRKLAATAEYFYYRFDVGSAVALPIGVTSYRERSGVRGGLTLWLPFVRN